MTLPIVENLLEILRGYYNFIKPHASLRFGPVTRTPAMQAGCANKALTFRGILAWVPPAGPGRRRQNVLDLTQPRKLTTAGA